MYGERVGTDNSDSVPWRGDTVVSGFSDGRFALGTFVPAAIFVYLISRKLKIRRYMGRYVNKKLKISWNEELAEHYGIVLSKAGYQVEKYGDDGSDEGSLDFGCEITPVEGKTIKQAIVLYGVVLDSKGRIICRSDSCRLYAENFYVEKLWSTGMCVNLKKLSEIKVYIEAL